MKFGNVSKIIDYLEVLWFFYNFLVFILSLICNYVFGVFLFCLNYSYWYVMNKILNVFGFFLFIFVLIRVKGLIVFLKYLVYYLIGNI